MYQNIILGLCYSCCKFGHKTINCRSYEKGRNTWNINSYENSRNHYEGNYLKNPCEAFDGNYNRFEDPHYEIECYKCKKFGHITRDYKSNFTGKARQVPFNHIEEQRTWKKKQEELKVEDCGLAVQDQNKISQWCVDNGCSKHTTGDKNIFLSLKK